MGSLVQKAVEKLGRCFGSPLEGASMGGRPNVEADREEYVPKFASAESTEKFFGGIKEKAAACGVTFEKMQEVTHTLELMIDYMMRKNSPLVAPSVIEDTRRKLAESWLREHEKYVRGA